MAGPVAIGDPDHLYEKSDDYSVVFSPVNEFGEMLCVGAEECVKPATVGMDTEDMGSVFECASALKSSDTSSYADGSINTLKLCVNSSPRIPVKNQKIVRCPKCPKKYSSEEELTRHLRKHLLKEQKNLRMSLQMSKLGKRPSNLLDESVKSGAETGYQRTENYDSQCFTLTNNPNRIYLNSNKFDDVETLDCKKQKPPHQSNKSSSVSNSIMRKSADINVKKANSQAKPAVSNLKRLQNKQFNNHHNIRGKGYKSKVRWKSVGNQKRSLAQTYVNKSITHSNKFQRRVITSCNRGGKKIIRVPAQTACKKWLDSVKDDSDESFCTSGINETSNHSKESDRQTKSTINNEKSYQTKVPQIKEFCIRLQRLEMTEQLIKQLDLFKKKTENVIGSSTSENLISENGSSFQPGSVDLNTESLEEQAEEIPYEETPETRMSVQSFAKASIQCESPSKMEYMSCKYCSKSFFSSNAFELHLLSHNISGNKCPMCEETFSRVSKLKSHINKHVYAAENINVSETSEDSFSEDDYVPESCRSTLSFTAANFICSECNTEMSFSEYRGHLRDRHKGMIPLSRNGWKPSRMTWTAKKRNIQFPDSSKARFEKESIHIYKKNRFIKFPCGFCPLNFDCNDSLTAHMNRKHNSQVIMNIPNSSQNETTVDAGSCAGDDNMCPHGKVLATRDMHRKLDIEGKAKDVIKKLVSILDIDIKESESDAIIRKISSSSGIHFSSLKQAVHTCHIVSKNSVSMTNERKQNVLFKLLVVSLVDPKSGVESKHFMRKTDHGHIYKCNYCDKEFKIDDLLTHMRVHTEEKSKFCDICVPSCYDSKAVQTDIVMNTSSVTSTKTEKSPVLEENLDSNDIEDTMEIVPEKGKNASSYILPDIEIPSDDDDDDDNYDEDVESVLCSDQSRTQGILDEDSVEFIKVRNSDEEIDPQHLNRTSSKQIITKSNEETLKSISASSSDQKLLLALKKASNISMEHNTNGRTILFSKEPKIHSISAVGVNCPSPSQIYYSVAQAPDKSKDNNKSVTAIVGHETPKRIFENSTLQNVKITNVISFEQERAKLQNTEKLPIDVAECIYAGSNKFYNEENESSSKDASESETTSMAVKSTVIIKPEEEKEINDKNKLLNTESRWKRNFAMRNLPHKCHVCSESFLSASSLKCHLYFHGNVPIPNTDSSLTEAH